MAHMAEVDKVLKVREDFEDLAVVCYINSSAELKAYSDVIVTSSNAVRIVKNLPNKNVFLHSGWESWKVCRTLSS